MTEIPKELIEVKTTHTHPCVRILCDKPMAQLGFLYFTIDGNEAGRIVFMREPIEGKETELVFHFNQTILAFENGDGLKQVKLTLRKAICEHFGAFDRTCDLED